MTERRRPEERAPGQVRPAAGSQPVHAPEDDAVLELQGLAGNRAVSELIGGTAEGPAPNGPSAGLRVRDLLRGLGRDAVAGPATAMGASVQRVTLDEKEVATWDAKAAYQEKSADAEKGAWDEKLPYGEAAYDEKASYDEKAAYHDQKAGYYAEKSSGEKSGGEKVAGEKSAGSSGARPMLAAGSAGPSVARLQTLLVDAGFAITPDGMFGPRTRAAVVSFQAGNGLAPDGIVGPMTWGALEGPDEKAGAAATGGLGAPGEMELVGPGAEMEKGGAPGSGEAVLPDEGALKKESAEKAGW